LKKKKVTLNDVKKLGEIVGKQEDGKDGDFSVLVKVTGDDRFAIVFSSLDGNTTAYTPRVAARPGKVLPWLESFGTPEAFLVVKDDRSTANKLNLYEHERK
jgi:hypothetical protein